jgi:hypothetical protein
MRFWLYGMDSADQILVAMATYLTASAVGLLLAAFLGRQNALVGVDFLILAAGISGGELAFRRLFLKRAD